MPINNFGSNLGGTSEIIVLLMIRKPRKLIISGRKIFVDDGPVNNYKQIFF